MVLIQTAYRQPFAKMMWCSVKDAAMGRPRGEITMSEDLNEVDLVETDAFAPPSDIALAVAISQKITPSLQYWRNVIASASCERSKASQRLFLAILCRADRRLIGGELNKSESPVRVRRRKINSARSRPVARRCSSLRSNSASAAASAALSLGASTVPRYCPRFLMSDTGRCPLYPKSGQTGRHLAKCA
jgi:hypothetical protein